ncbi:MAG TPA: hypothetical protein VF681_15955 [Abditibacteriaceae bacterium]|jgi:hypothetical protein
MKKIIGFGIAAAALVAIAAPQAHATVTGNPQQAVITLNQPAVSSISAATSLPINPTDVEAISNAAITRLNRVSVPFASNNTNGVKLSLSGSAAGTLKPADVRIKATGTVGSALGGFGSLTALPVSTTQIWDSGSLSQNTAMSVSLEVEVSNLATYSSGQYTNDLTFTLAETP